ncbi:MULTISPECIES: hypothetical protein [unclassified Nostoc]|uniref:hypothetical protein n=1 Tax=unclassified Nostoc TaxID=2593658 RepID=UPI0026104C86|nr:hypothetical protein [Nostoc sp. S13]MDF5737623.1 hypothetical protein [Nostoc sp. S13]
MDQIKAGYINLRNYPPLLENTVNTIVLSPLLFIGKFYLPPFHLKLEKSIEIETLDKQTIIKGRIDFLLLNQGQQFRGTERLISQTFPDLNLTAE